jgi:RNA-directed DNA polymerase
MGCVNREHVSRHRAVISPILANLYLHYVLDLWVNQWRRKKARGDVIIVRYADDAVLGFQYRHEALRFLAELKERVGKFGLELHPEKTRLIAFGRHTAKSRKKFGEGRPETFNFLGFTHYCGTNRKTGHFCLLRKTIGKRMTAKLKAIAAQLHKRRHDSIKDTQRWLQSVVRGYFQYHAIPGNWARMEEFRKNVLRLWHRSLRRRSDKSRWTWTRFRQFLVDQIPEVRILHPFPERRFDAKHSR